MSQVTILAGSSGGTVTDILGGNNIAITGTPTSIPIINVSGTTEHSLLVGNATHSINSLGVANNGEIPIGSTGVDPVLATITAGSGVAVANGAGSITLSSTAASIAFQASLENNQFNITGNGAVYPIRFDSIDFYYGLTGYDETTGIWTVPVTGFYNVSALVSMLDISSAMTQGIITITNNITQPYYYYYNPFSSMNTDGIGSVTCSAVMFLAATATVNVTVQISGGAGNTAGLASVEVPSLFGAILIG